LFIFAVVLDAVYQFIAFRAFHVGQTLIVTVVLAIVPYVLIRGAVTRLAGEAHKDGQRGPHRSISR